MVSSETEPRKLYEHPDQVLAAEFQIIRQGAEAIVCETLLLSGQPCIAKFRPHKAYRHAVLDAKLTRRRCILEARLLQRARLYGVDVPTLLAVDDTRGLIMMEKINGASVRDILGSRDIARLPKPDLDCLMGLMQRIGAAVAHLHGADIVHGDLTTSNIMTREPASTTQSTESNTGSADPLPTAAGGSVVIIDFGLGQVSSMDEDKAVDLYVLERAFSSTHPNSSALNAEVLAAYTKAYPNGGAEAVMKRLEDVRARGRKRTMAG